MDSSIISKEDVNAIFLNVEVIYRFSHELLIQLETMFPNPDQIEPGAQIGTVFMQLGHYFKFYSTYCSNYKSSLDHSIHCEKNNLRYAQFLKDTQEKHSECKGLSLKDLLIKPVQRLCKYPLLFSELLKATPEDHPDYEAVASTYALFETITQTANKESAEKENTQKLALFTKIVDGIPDENAYTGRKVIRDEWLSVTYAANPNANRHVYLFNDHLVITRKKRRVSSNFLRKNSASNAKLEELLHMIILNDMKAEVKDIVDDGKHIFQLSEDNTQNEITTYLFYCPSLGSKLQWIEDLSRCIETSKSQFTTKRFKTEKGSISNSGSTKRESSDGRIKSFSRLSSRCKDITSSKDARDAETRDKDIREKEAREKEAREKETREKEVREKEMREKEIREKEIRDKGPEAPKPNLIEIGAARRRASIDCPNKPPTVPTIRKPDILPVSPNQNDSSQLQIPTIPAPAAPVHSAPIIAKKKILEDIAIVEIFQTQAS